MTLSIEAKRKLIEPDHAGLSIRRQCGLLGLNRASYYYQAAPETAENLRLMRLIDEEYMRHPFLGSRRIAEYLCRQGYRVNRKRIQRLMRIMGIAALYPKPKLSKRHPDDKVYPYLLRDLAITAPNQVWSTDITYVPMPDGFMYLVAVIDWYSRYVLSWQLSNTLDGWFCLEALEQALERGTPSIFNTDQGCQFTAGSFTGRLEAADISVSMDGRGRALDNVFIERLWRSVKYEDIYLQGYEDVPSLDDGLTTYFGYYNDERLHQSLGYKTPAEVHYGLD